MHKLWYSAGDIPLPSSPNHGLIGILNITPDSFYDGGNYLNPERALSRARKMVKEGAHILDIGAESTRPGSLPVSAENELERLRPVLTLLLQRLPQIPFSIDTRNALTAEFALKAGAKIINDVSSGNHDPRLIEILTFYKPAYILTHSRGNPQTMQINPVYKNVIIEIKKFFEEKLNWLIKHGLPENRIILDPGIGFGKTAQHNLEILRNYEKFKEFGRPLLCAVSMKSVFGCLLNHSLTQRSFDSAFTATCLLEKGTFWFRVHEVSKTRDALNLHRLLK